MTMQDDATSSVKETGTCAKIDTLLTQPGSPNVLRELIVMRSKVGRETRDGYLLSNLIEQMCSMNENCGDRTWARHPTQQLAWIMSVQLNRLSME